MPHTAFRTVTVKDEAVLLQVVRAHSKNSGSYQQKGSHPMCQRNREIYKRKFVLGGLLERRLFSFLCIHWVDEVLHKAQILHVCWEKSPKNWQKHWNKIAAFKPTLADATVCSDLLWLSVLMPKHSCHTCRGAHQCDAPVLTSILLQSKVAFIFWWNKEKWN